MNIKILICIVLPILVGSLVSYLALTNVRNMDEMLALVIGLIVAPWISIGLLYLSYAKLMPNIPVFKTILTVLFVICIVWTILASAGLFYLYALGSRWRN